MNASQPVGATLAVGPAEQGPVRASDLEHAADPAVLGPLAEQLRLSGLQEFCSSFDPGTPSLAPYRRHLAAAPAELGAVIRLFLLGEPVAPSDLPPGIRGCVEGLLTAGLLRNGDAGVATPGLVLRHVAGLWLFIEKPGPRPAFYFGEDSIALMVRLAPLPGGRALDLCSGPGIQALHCSSYAASVVATERNPAAAALLRVNAALNGRQDRVDVRVGDLFEPVGSMRFDTVAANPPFLPVPDDLAYPAIGHGGADGLAITRRIVEGLPAALAERGSAQIVATLLGDEAAPLWAAGLAEWAARTSFDVLVTVLSRAPFRPGAALFEGLIQPVCALTATSRDDVAAAFCRSLDAQGATHLLGSYLLVRPGRGRFETMDLSSGVRSNMWFVEPGRRPEWYRPRDRVRAEARAAGAAPAARQ